MKNLHGGDLTTSERRALMALRRAVVLAALTQLVSPFRVGAPRACALQQCRARARVRAVASGGETVRAAAPSGTASQSPFADLLRDAAPYIAMHRDSAMVIHIPGEVIDRPAEFSAIMDDLALLNLLGVEVRHGGRLRLPAAAGSHGALSPPPLRTFLLSLVR